MRSVCSLLSAVTVPYQCAYVWTDGVDETVIKVTDLCTLIVFTLTTVAYIAIPGRKRPGITTFGRSRADEVWARSRECT